eukprot:3160676-Amphidinium_carterae.1
MSHRWKKRLTLHKIIFFAMYTYDLIVLTEIFMATMYTSTAANHSTCRHHFSTLATYAVKGLFIVRAFAVAYVLRRYPLYEESAAEN